MPVQQARARNRQQRILSAAAQVFARRGYSDAAIDEIALTAGTSKGGLYFHFPGKEALLFALLDHTATLLMGKLRTAMDAEADPVAKATAALLVLLRTLGKHRTLARVFAIEALGAGPRFNQRLLVIQQQFEEVIQEQLDQAVADGVIEPIDTRVTAQAWVGILNAVLARWLLTPSPGRLEDLFPTLRLLLLRSVGAATDTVSAER